MKRIIVITIVLSIIFAFDYKAYADSRDTNVVIDDVPPVMNVIEDNLMFFDNQDIDYLEYVKAYDDQSDTKLSVVNSNQTNLPGKRKIKIEAEDASGNKSYAYINVTIVSSKAWNEFIIDNTYNYPYRNLNNDIFLEEKDYVDYNAFNLALDFVGMKGSCNEIAQKFIDCYFGEGHNVLIDTYSISSDEAKPGDIIYYTNGGLGQQHYAVYLGGSSALHGNINGKAVIGCVYMSHGSTPQFYRLKGLE